MMTGFGMRLSAVATSGRSDSSRLTGCSIHAVRPQIFSSHCRPSILRANSATSAMEWNCSLPSSVTS